ncbi:MAG: PAS domain S-box protein [Gammaproteobacteria bacterium]|nr:MAG: PAS domain S-box protein [Gammaproteobacteria bacterium]
MKTLLRKQLERARRDAADDKSVLRRLLPMVLKQYRVFQERIESLDQSVGNLRRDLQEFSTDDRTSRDQRLRAVVDNVKDGIATVSQEGQILSVNLTAERIFGYRPGTLIGHHLSLLLPFPDHKTAAGYLDELSQTKDCTVAEMSPYQIDGRHRTGKTFPADVVVSRALVEEDDIFIVGIRDMTERVSAERALRESESRYRSLVDSAPEAIVVYDVDAGRFVDVNESALNMFGWDRKSMLNLGPQDISAATQEDGRASADPRGYISAALEGKTPVFEWVHKDRRGREIPCEIRLARIDAQGKRLVRGSITDISDRKRAEILADGEKNVLEGMASNAPLSEVLNSITLTVGQVSGDACCAILLLDRAGHRLKVNSAPNLPKALVDAIDGVPVDVLAGAPSPDRAIAETVIMADMGTDPLWAKHRELAEKHGLKSCWSTPIRTSDERILGAFAVFYPQSKAPVTKSFDLFDRMTRLAGIAIERKQAEKTIRASEARFRGLFENVLDGVYQVGADGVFVSANPALVKMLGYESEAELKAIGPTRNLYVDPLQQNSVLDSLHRDGQVRNAELRLRRRDGSAIIVLENSRVVRDESGIVTGYEGTLSDITERKRSELAIHEAKERAEVTLKSIADGVITTDADGRVDYLNPVAEQLTGWTMDEASGRPVVEIIQIMDENSGEAMEDPVTVCLREGCVTELGQHTILVDRDGAQIAIQDSAAPIRDHHGRVMGSVMVFHDVNKERSLRRQLAYQASHDPLTGLINRREFETQLEGALEASRRDANLTHVLLYLDLDQFKIVNDTCGHSAGDQLLQQLTSLITRRVRVGDVICRLGGDEFGVLLSECGLERAVEVADDLRQAIREYRFFWQDAAFDIGVSIGVVSVDEDSESVAALLSAADVACYAAKDQGRNRLHIYQHGDAAERHAEMQWVSRVTRAIEDDRLELYFQPIVPIGDNSDRRDHYELLLRMRDEQGKLVCPDSFIPAAERYNLMPALDRWVLKYALDNLAYKGDGDRDDGYTLAVNFSGTSLNDDKFLDHVLSELERHDLVPGSICFEITETAAISNLQRVAHFMSEVKKRGCEFSLDDFGSGLSSFTYLKNLPVDYLKIDGHFVKNLMSDRIDQTMVAAITTVGNAMGIRTVAEHVDSRRVLETLVSIGVEFAQGYLIAKPAPVSEFPPMVGNRPVRELKLA